MIWFKHMTDMVDDPKIRRLIRKHGALGYAVYNLALERIGKRLTTDQVIPDLEETSEDIADLLREDTVKVEDAILTAIQLGLFEQDEVTGRLLCSKIYKFLEQSQTSSKKLRQMIAEYHGKVMTRHGDVMTDNGDVSGPVIKSEEKRREEKRIEYKSDASAPPVNEPSPLRDTLADYYQRAFTSKQPASTWSNHGKERKHCNDLAKKTRAFVHDSPYESELDAAKAVLREFWDARETERGEFWTGAPFAPSGLATRWDKVCTRLARKYGDKQADDEGLAAVKRMYDSAS